MKPVVSALNAWSWYAPSSQTVSIESPIALTPRFSNSVIISVFAIVILSVLGSLYNSNNHAYTGSEGEPKDGPAVAASIYTAVIVYAVRHSSIPIPKPRRGRCMRKEPVTDNALSGSQGFFVFCGFQAYLHMRDSRGGAISLH
ncbi:Pc12g06850 [Penicillium rubens Wisconsin 54-1255]|uniref:Pc12g06850 protein n=1 Tax=Penicillium rubens (strain ATCC 28089 / DSM 1075 / NRRL 1951 / Wisconsin 54-1255) TaxID=500485 RepID=B6H0P5_PENRW|nr:Pc12g06850 [Penicillium rubens Wisconsin 54-1255]